MGEIYVMVGAPGSGKSTFVKNHINTETDAWVSRDEIRFSLLKPNEPYFSKENEVFRVFINMIRMFLIQGKNVWVDATHLNIKSRAKLLNRLNKKDYKITAFVIDESLNRCILNNEKRAGTRAYVQPHVIAEMYDSMTTPTLAEGFDKVIIIKNKYE